MQHVTGSSPRLGMRTFVPIARYYHLGDYVEYVRSDAPHVLRRVDQFLTLVLDMETRELSGFRLKGFRNFFVKHLRRENALLDADFLALVSAIEIAAKLAGDSVFSIEEAKAAYRNAYSMAFEDKVALREVPTALAA
ncbi:MAG: hypothetical protein ACKVP5_20650 [Aestuariivirga sp.]